MNDTLTLQLHHKILIGLFIVIYFVSMGIQVRDPKVNVRISDWIYGFLCSVVGGTVAYFFVMGWANIGLRMGVTLLFSLISYRLVSFIVSDEAQGAFASGFWNGILNIWKNFTNKNQNNNNDDIRR